MALVAAKLGMPLMPWQQQVLDVAGEYDRETGIPAYREVIVTVPRQSGKTTAVLAAVLDRALKRDRPQRVAYTAQTGLDARQKVANDWMPLLRRSPFASVITRTLRSNSETAIEFRTGSRLEVLASAEDAGHGRTLDLGIIDEAHADEDDRREQAMVPAMSTRDDAQIFIYSTMGTTASTFLNRKVAAGRAAAEASLTSDIAYFEWSAPREADPDDPATWWACMPALGHTISEATVRHAQRSMSEGEFRRAYLNQQRDEDVAWLPRGAWAACSGHVAIDPSMPIGVGIRRAPDGSGGCIAIAQRQGERLVTDWRWFEAEAATGHVRTEDMREHLRTLAMTYPSAAIRDEKGWPVRGPAFGFDRMQFAESAETLDEQGLNMIHSPLGAAHMGPATTTTYEAVVTHRLVHRDDARMSYEVAATGTRSIERGEVITVNRATPNHGAIALVMAIGMATIDPAPPPAKRRTVRAAGF